MKTNTKINPFKLDYPYLGIWKDSVSNFVVLFSEPATGMIIHVEGDGWPLNRIGWYSNTWSEDEFIAYDGIVELSNV